MIDKVYPPENVYIGLQKPYKIYSFYIDERFISKEVIEYSVKITLEYESKILNYFYGFNDYVSSFGNRCDFESRFACFDKDEILVFIKFIVKKWNIKNYLIENR